MITVHRWPALIALVVMTLGIGMASATAQERTGKFTRPDDPGQHERLHELQEIRFEGLVQTTPEQLIGIVASRASELSITRQLTRYYYDNLKRNPSTPRLLMRHLDTLNRDLESELRYFDPRTAESDSAALLTYLNQNGFHTAQVEYQFGPDVTTDLNTLVFSIAEGPRAVIDTIIYVGLDDLPDDVRARVDDVRTVRPGTSYSESAVDDEVRAVFEELRNNGYFRAWYDQPFVGRSADHRHDTVVVVMEPGARCRISAIVFEENTGGYPKVTEGTRRRQLEFQPGEWYSAEKVMRSRNNLITLGVFENVGIDTIPADQRPPNIPPDTDSSIALRVFTRNAKYYDVGLDLLLYQTSIDNYLNFGIGALALHRNIFGGAQQLNLQLQFVLQDISRAFQGQQLETETIAQLGFFWPSAFRLFDQRTGVIGNAYYSLRRLVETFRLESSGLSLRLPVTLYTHTFFNGLELSLSAERQVPREYQGALRAALESAQTQEEIENILQTFLAFSALDAHLQQGAYLTGLFAGLSLRGEHRDNPVNPKRGTFTSFSGEFGYGAGKFVRLQFFSGTYTPLHERLIVATKVRLGHIALIDPSNVYVPLERQFFAGGAASIRSYASRQLHDTASGRIMYEDPADERVFNNILGSASLIELGFELRFTFSRPAGWPDLWATFVERSGITLFTDVGNAFNRLTTAKYGTARFQDFLSGSVVAAGIGYRFETPVGPFRIDYATSIYDPAKGPEAVIWNGRRDIFAFSNWNLSIGLGHAF